MGGWKRGFSLIGRAGGTSHRLPILPRDLPAKWLPLSKPVLLNLSFIPSPAPRAFLDIFPNRHFHEILIP